MSDNLKGKVAVVTGASSGIGEATVLALANEGAKVAIVARRADRLEKLVQHLSETGKEAMSIVADITDEAQAHDVISKVNAEFGRVDILVKNAGVMLLGPIDDADTEDWRRMVNTNVLGLMYATHAVLPIMKAQGEGHIVNISSVAGRTASAGSGVYNAQNGVLMPFLKRYGKKFTKTKFGLRLLNQVQLPPN